MKTLSVRVKKTQLGISLIEVLISMALGIFFLGIAVEFLITGQQSSTVQDAGSRIQENARFSFSILQDDIRLAGFNGNPGGLGALQAAAVNAIYQGNCQLSNPCTTDDVGTVGDRLAVTMVLNNNITTDCLGTAGLGNGTQIANVYSVQLVNGVNSLYCRGWDINAGAWTAPQQPLVDGVEQMQVQYGIAGSRYLSAASVTAANQWGLVSSVRIALLVDSGLQTDSSNQAGTTAFANTDATYAMLDGPDYQPGDNRIRRVYTTTIELNNSL